MAISIKDGAGATVSVKSITDGADQVPVHVIEGPMLGAITETVPASDTASSGVNGRLQRLAQRLTSLIALLPTSVGGKTGALSLSVVSATDDLSLTKLDTINTTLTGGLAGLGYKSTISVTRPSNTTAYTAGDVVGATAATITFTSIGIASSHLLVTSATLLWETTAVIAGMSSFRLHLYDVTPPSALADNAVWDLPAGDRSSYLGYIDMGIPVDFGSSLYQQTDNVNKQIRLGASTSVFGYLVSNSAYTPASASVYRIALHTVSA